MPRNLLLGKHNPYTSQCTSSSLLVYIIAKQEPTNISNIFQGSLKSCSWYSPRYPLWFWASSNEYDVVIVT